VKSLLHLFLWGEADFIGAKPISSGRSLLVRPPEADKPMEDLTEMSLNKKSPAFRKLGGHVFENTKFETPNT